MPGLRGAGGAQRGNNFEQDTPNRPLVRRFDRKPLGRDLIVGDAHGCFTKLQASLDAVGFNLERDRLFSVGDLVDRGPESAHTLRPAEPPSPLRW